MKLFGINSGQNKEKKRDHRSMILKNMKVLLPVVVAMILVVGLSVGGTMAYMQESTDKVTNTFKAGKITYELTLMPNADGVTMPDELTAQSSTSLSATFSPNEPPTKTGYAFGGWYYGSDCADADLHTEAPGREITVEYGDPHDENSAPNKVKITLYAKWTPITYQVKYEANCEGAVSGSMENSVHTYDVEKNLTKNAYERAGYKFLGWGTSAEAAEAAYADEQPVKNLTAEKDAVVTLYAIWQQMDFVVTFDSQVDGVTPTPENKTVTYLKAYGDLASAERAGYTLSGWSLDQEGVQPITADSTVEIAGNHTLYAQWMPNPYVIQYDANSGTGVMADTPAVYDQEAALATNEFAKTGYTFSGWNTSADGSGTAYAEGAVVKNLATEGVVTLYAQWTPITYTVTYHQNADQGSVTGSTADSVHTYDVPGNLTANGYARTGYTFANWNTKPDGTGTAYGDGGSVVNLTAENNGTVTLYAQWAAKSYTIRYHANGGEGTMADQVIKYDVPTSLRKNTFTKDDHSFGGWALTPDGEKKYIDEQIIVNLLENGVLDLYAVWQQNTHTVYFDYNGGIGTPAQIEVLKGEPYGVLPEYPVHPVVIISETENMSYLFTGWYTERDGGTRVYPSDIVQRGEDHTLYAHWKEAPTNNIIQNLTVKNNPDDNKDGVVDAFYVNLTCSSFFEKYNIPLENLVKGQRYKLSFTESNNATYGMNEYGYGGAIYGFIITKDKSLTPGSIKEEAIADGGLIKTFDDRYDGQLNGPRNWETTFVAEDSTMYWTWDYGLIQDNYPRDYNYTNIKLVPVVTEIKFDEKQLIVHESSNAKVLNDTSGAYATNFTFDGASYAETMYFPITGLKSGTTYTITFDHTFSGRLINSETYDYGCGIMSEKPTKFGSKMADIGVTDSKASFVMNAVANKTESVTFEFKAAGETAYWVWNMANCSDSNNCTIDVKVTNFSAKHAEGGLITYYQAPSAATLDLMPAPVQEIEFVWSGIDDTNMEIWYPVDEQYPTAGDSYELAFEPLEGCKMAETITVVIDDVTYEVSTVEQLNGEAVTPVYDPEKNILTIPAELLTEETTIVAVAASAVAAEAESTEEPDPLAGQEDLGEETVPAAPDTGHETEQGAEQIGAGEAAEQMESTLHAVEVEALPQETESSAEQQDEIPKEAEE